MKFVICISIIMNIVFAKTIYTPFENINNISVLGKIDTQSYEMKNKWKNNFEKQIIKYILQNGFKKNIGKLYKKNTVISEETINKNKILTTQYTVLATNNFDLKQPTFKIMINYLDESYPEYQELIKNRNKGIKDEKQKLIKQQLHVSQQFFIYQNSYSGFDIAFSEQYTILNKQESGRLRVGVFDDNNENYLFVEDNLNPKLLLEEKTKKTIKELKKLILNSTHDFYNPTKIQTYKLLPQKKQVIITENLVTTAVPDDSDSSRVECDSDLTLNNENVSIQLDKINAYIYKIAPYNDTFILPNETEGVAWKSFYWKYKKISLINKLAQLGEYEKEFLNLLSKFIKKEKNQLKKLLQREDLPKIKLLFISYWNKNKIESKKIENFLASVDIVDLIALGMR